MRPRKARSGLRLALHQAAAAVALIAMTACPRDTAMQIVAGSTASNLAFSISEGSGQPVAIEYFGVWTCASDASGYRQPLWVIEADSGAVSIPDNRVRYGVAPSGFTTSEGPQVLVPGCYRAQIPGTGQVDFDVRPNGEIDSAR